MKEERYSGNQEGDASGPHGSTPRIRRGVDVALLWPPLGHAAGLPTVALGNSICPQSGSSSERRRAALRNKSSRTAWRPANVRRPGRPCSRSRRLIGNSISAAGTELTRQNGRIDQPQSSGARLRVRTYRPGPAGLMRRQRPDGGVCPIHCRATLLSRIWAGPPGLAF